LTKTAPDIQLGYQVRRLGVQVNLSHCVLCTLSSGFVHTVLPKGTNKGLNGDSVQPTGTPRNRSFGYLLKSRRRPNIRTPPLQRFSPIDDSPLIRQPGSADIAIHEMQRKTSKIFVSDNYPRWRVYCRRLAAVVWDGKSCFRKNSALTSSMWGPSPAPII
jgi:hypothetical protein